MISSDILPLHPDVFTLTSWDGSGRQDIDGLLHAMLAATRRAVGERAIVYVKNEVTGQTILVYADGTSSGWTRP